VLRAAVAKKPQNRQCNGLRVGRIVAFYADRRK